jgi:hypothetical protein
MTRLRLASDIGRGSLDGGWWPVTRDLARELIGLAAALPPDLGTIVRVEVSPADWGELPPIAHAFADEDADEETTHTIDLEMSGGTTLRLLVIPPAMTDDQGEEALLAAATKGYEHTAASLLETVSEYPDVDPDDQWLG